MSHQPKAVAPLALLAASLIAPASAANDAVAPTAPLGAPLDAVGVLVKLAGSGKTLTQTAADQYVALVPRFDADSSTLALSILPAFTLPDSSTAIVALRHHVRGLAASLLQAPGIDVSRLGATATDLVASFHPRGVSYSAVSLTYTFDNWATVQTAALSLGPGGIYGTTLPNAPAQGAMVYALELTGKDGQTFWYNNPREYASRQAIAANYFRDVAIVGSPLPTSRPVLALLLEGYTLPESLGGAAVTNDELSALVAQMTWEGQSGIDSPDAIDPALAELDAMVARGVAFNGVDTLIRNFLTQQRFRTASWTGGSFVRGDDGMLSLQTKTAGVQSMTVYYATDAWNSPHQVTCAADRGIASCALGDIAKGAYLAYAVALTTSTTTTSVTAPDGGNFFEKVR